LAAVTATTVPAGLDLESLEFTPESIGDFAVRERPDAQFDVLLALAEQLGAVSA
jgi:hypothetical protein